MSLHEIPDQPHDVTRCFQYSVFVRFSPWVCVCQPGLTPIG